MRCRSCVGKIERHFTQLSDIKTSTGLPTPRMIGCSVRLDQAEAEFTFVLSAASPRLPLVQLDELNSGCHTWRTSTTDLPVAWLHKQIEELGFSTVNPGEP
ncbi:unnamed protein product [Protopolystoma xenopodis]|uniref:Uncharacterized protein n=1 Tax=Protopolystoma xenopodis TaxID=117903 RepID=A0A3S5C7W4_9PLAT|nr:unnamed protein product [Protopolystoma xenopodis]